MSVGTCGGRCRDKLKISITSQFREGRRFPTLETLFFHGCRTRHIYSRTPNLFRCPFTEKGFYWSASASPNIRLRWKYLFKKLASRLCFAAPTVSTEDSQFAKRRSRQHNASLFKDMTKSRLSNLPPWWMVGIVKENKMVHFWAEELWCLALNHEAAAAGGLRSVAADF